MEGSIQPTSESSTQTSHESCMDTLAEAQYQQLSSILDNADTPMISDPVPPALLTDEYRGNPLPGFLPGIEYLNRTYSSMRRVRGDGNCFYRSFLFAYLENITKNITSNPAAREECERFRTMIVETKDKLVAIGYEEFIFEIFFDETVELLDTVLNTPAIDLLPLFQADGKADHYTWYMRLLTALSMRSNPDNYMPFIIDSMCPDIDSFVRTEVEPMGKECDQMQIVAISELLGVSVRIEYLDGREFKEELSAVEINNQANSEFRNVNLLYRPGHYDILYK